MKSQKTKFAVGLFVFSGMAIAILAIVWLGMSRFLAKGNYYATYFNESVQGLNIDSAVKYRGVAIGRVDRIEVAPDSKLIQVVLKIESGQRIDGSTVAQLKSVGITGSIYVELDRKKPGDPDRSPPLSFPSEYPIIASKPSEITLLLGGLDEVLQEIKSMNISEISDGIKTAVTAFNTALSEADIKGISGSLQGSLVGARNILEDGRWTSILASVDGAARSLDLTLTKAVDLIETGQNTLGRLETIIAKEEETLLTAVEGFKEAVDNANLFLEKGSGVLGGTEESLAVVKGSLMVITQNLERASQNLDRLLERVADHPPALLFGAPPAPRAIEKGNVKSPSKENRP